MDADRNGIPCETVFTGAEVNEIIRFDDGATLPSGLFCRDIESRGLGYAPALVYWVREGGPDRMDADRNGIPCETVYPFVDIAAVLQFDAAG
jgi:hypothetical protein